MKPYHLVLLFIVIVGLIAPKLIAGVGLAAFVVGVILLLVSAALGFPGLRSKNRP